MNRCNGRAGLRARKSGTAARQEATKPFMSQAPRAYSRPSARRRVNGSLLQAWPSTGTVSTWPDSATPPAACGPMMAWMFAFCPVASVLIRYGNAVRIEIAAHEVDQRQVGVAAGRVEGDQARQQLDRAHAGGGGWSVHAPPVYTDRQQRQPEWAAMRAPRVAILGLHLEANAFAPPTTRADFDAQCWEEGEAITRLARAVSHLPSELPGFYARMDKTGPWTPVPILIAAAPPGGPIEQGSVPGNLRPRAHRPGGRAAGGCGVYPQPWRVLGHRR